MIDRNPQATVVIVSKNRKNELRKAVRSALMQRGRIDVLVIDDASTDGTDEMMRIEFPQAEYQRAEVSSGCIAHRNHGIMNARAPIVFVIDDDATFGSPDSILETLKEFEHPRVGAVALPFVELGKTMKQKAPDCEHIWATDSFIGAAHAVRKSVFIKLGGFREALGHFYEESDLCNRILQAGYIVRLGNAPAGTHDFSTHRDYDREHYFATRNSIYFAWHNVPTMYVFPRILGKTTQILARSLRTRQRVGTTLRGIGAGLRACVSDWGKRQPPTRAAYHLYRQLKTRKAVRLDEIESLLPAIA